MSMEEKDQEDVMQRLLELGGDKKFLTFDDLNFLTAFWLEMNQPRNTDSSPAAG